jgi:Icc-related predicted phosphoesterase
MVRIVSISDTHRQHRQVEVPECDLLLFAGDIGWEDDVLGYNSMIDWFDWFSSRRAKKKVFIVGNHDVMAEGNHTFINQQAKKHDIIYLYNSSVRLFDLNIWGSPFSLEFCDWAFSIPKNEIIASSFWARIPKKTDIVITHGPPLNIFDNTIYEPDGHFGDEWLGRRIEQVKPKLHVFGHFHYSFCQKILKDETIYINASICDEQYQPIGKPVEVDL